MMIIPKISKPISSEQVLENREDYDEARLEFNRQIENFRQAGYQKGVLSFFSASQTDFIQNARKLNMDNSQSNEKFDFLLVVPRNFRSIYDQMSSLGTVARNITPLEISDVVACPNKPYCLYGLNTGVVEDATKSSVGQLKNQNHERLGLTDIEIISLFIQFPELSKYQVFATGSKVGKTAYPFLKKNDKGEIDLLSATDSYCGCGPMEKNLIVPSCQSRSL